MSAGCGCSDRGYLAIGQALAMFALQSETLPVFLAWVSQEAGDQEPNGFFDAGDVRSDLRAFARLLPLVEAAVGPQVMRSLVAQVAS
jgi:hypothetical protein